MVLASAPFSTQAQAAAGTIKRVQGESQIVSMSGSRAVAVGGSIYAGDRVVTAGESAVGVTLHDGTQMAVGPDAAVTVQSYQFDPTTRQGSLMIDVARGAMRMVSGLIARQDPAAVKVNTPTATIGIRGTDFIVDVDEPALAR